MRSTHALAATMVSALLGTVSAAAQAPAQGPPAVTVERVQTQDVSPRYENIGRVEAVQWVDLRARVSGYLQKVDFQEGQTVKEGDLLYVIEPDLYQAALTHAQASLESAEATLKEMSVNLVRYRELRKNENVSQAQLDTATAQNGTATANVLLAQADVHTAEINLGYTKIMAPITGRIGKTNFTIGNYVDTSSGPLARIVQIDPIRVVFSVSERDFVSVRQATPGESLPKLNEQFVPMLQLPNGSDYPEAGKVEFVDNQVDPNTGTIAIRALFTNREGILLPGETVNIITHRAQARIVPVVPLRAVQENNDGKFVLVVGADNKIEQRQIQASLQVGQNWAVDKGLQGGEMIVVEGLQKVKPGMVVRPVSAASTAQK